MFLLQQRNPLNLPGLLLASVLAPFSFLSLSFPAHAAGYTQSAAIASLETDNQGTYVFVRFSQSIGNPDNCGATDLYVFDMQGLNNPEGMLSFLVSAYHAQSPVTLFVNGCSLGFDFTVTRPIIQRTRLDQ